MEKPSVDPTFTFGVSLLLSLVFWYPSLRTAMDGGIDMMTAGIRYLLALGVAWLGVYGVSAIVAFYATQGGRRMPRAAADAPQRRHDDTGDAGDAGTD